MSHVVHLVPAAGGQCIDQQADLILRSAAVLEGIDDANSQARSPIISRYLFSTSSAIAR
jgi:hypothetical protein